MKYFTAFLSVVPPFCLTVFLPFFLSAQNVTIKTYANISGTGNSAFGHGVLNINTTGDLNTAVGLSSLNLNTTGNRNTAIGNVTIAIHSTGNRNVAIGTKALYLNTVRSNLVATGDSALYKNGRGAKPEQAILNTAIGSNIVAIGQRAGTHLTNGSGNVFLGYGAWPAPLFRKFTYF